ncbi:hypothetical protein NDU88_002036 [Pleurodeles waltl]|uniref:Uncharacterized protein n=1 Tax=Pleurodeles waltl TaxID=8319 RepID=A0AAV7MLG4_PLEWA|nr:hypothetical protein NDU88_002036 [Pleurodeles waltl]
MGNARPRHSYICHSRLISEAAISVQRTRFPSFLVRVTSELLQPAVSVPFSEEPDNRSRLTGPLLGLVHLRYFRPSSELSLLLY